MDENHKHTEYIARALFDELKQCVGQFIRRNDTSSEKQKNVAICMALANATALHISNNTKIKEKRELLLDNQIFLTREMLKKLGQEE